MSLENVANIYFGMLERRDKLEYQGEQVRLADERTQLQRDQQRLRERQFEEQKEQNDIAQGYTEALAEGQNLRNQKSALTAKQEAAGRLTEETFGILRSHAGYPDENGDLQPLIETTSSGLRLSPAFRTAIKEKDRVAMDLIAKWTTSLGMKQAMKDAGYEYKGDTTLLTPTGRVDADGNPYYAINGQYADGEAGALTDDATTAPDDGLSEFTIDDLYNHANTYFTSIILNGSEEGRIIQNNIRSSTSKIDMQLSDISQALGALEVEVHERITSQANIMDDPGKARALFAQYQAEDDKDKPEVLFKLIESLNAADPDNPIEIPEILKVGGTTRLAEGLEFKGEAPAEIMARSGTESIGVVGDPIYEDLNKSIKEKYGIMLAPPLWSTPEDMMSADDPDTVVDDAARFLTSGIHSILGIDPSKPRQLRPDGTFSLTERAKAKVQKARAQQRGDKDISKEDKELINKRDQVTRYDRQLIELDKQIQEAGDSPAGVGYEKQQEEVLQKRQALVNETNAGLYNQTVEDIGRAKRRIELSKTPEQRKKWEQKLETRQAELDQFFKAGLVTDNMRTEAFESLSAKVWGEDGADLVRGRNITPEDKETILRSVDERLDAGIQFTPLEINAAEQQMKQAYIDSRDRLSSASFENQVIARAAMIMSADESQRPALRAELDNLINTGDATLSTYQRETLGQNQQQLEAQARSAEASHLREKRLYEAHYAKLIKDNKTAEAERLKLSHETYQTGFKDFMDTELAGETFGGKTLREVINAFPQQDYYAGSGSMDNDFSQIYDMLDDQIDKFVEYDADGIPTVLSQNQKVFDKLQAEKDRLAMYFIQNKAKQGTFDFWNDFASEFDVSSARNLQANHSDPEKAQSFFFIGNTGRNKGKEVSIGGLSQQEDLRRYLIARAKLNAASQAAQP